ncbi:hypothetical protein DFH29DRAFT_1029353 [Suillus ampliporus]|nr:hypothetical protein DFH29DRAFT_1029353 [Suillus ampliporus]
MQGQEPLKSMTPTFIFVLFDTPPLERKFTPEGNHTDADDEQYTPPMKRPTYHHQTIIDGMAVTSSLKCSLPTTTTVAVMLSQKHNHLIAVNMVISFFSTKKGTELHQRGEDHIEEGKEGKEEQTKKDNDNDNEVQPARNSHKWSDGPIPMQLQFYPLVYKDLLEKVKKWSRLESLDNLFPHCETFLAEDVIEILAELHNQFAVEGRSVEEGYWERYKHDMTIILWDDLGNMCSEFKKAAHPIAQSQYELFRKADECEDDDDAMEYIHNGIKELKDDGKFL